MHPFDVAPPAAPSICEELCQSSCSCSRPKPALPPRHSTSAPGMPALAQVVAPGCREAGGRARVRRDGVGPRPSIPVAARGRTPRRRRQPPVAAATAAPRPPRRSHRPRPVAEERRLSQSPTAAMATPSPPVGGLCSSRSPAPPVAYTAARLGTPLLTTRTLQDDGRSSPGRCASQGNDRASTRVPCPWPATPAAPSRGTPHHGAGRAARRRRPPRRQGGRRRAAPGWQARSDRGGARCRHGRKVIAARPIGATTSSRMMPKTLSTMTFEAEALDGTHRQGRSPFRTHGPHPSPGW